MLDDPDDVEGLQRGIAIIRAFKANDRDGMRALMGENASEVAISDMWEALIEVAAVAAAMGGIASEAVGFDIFEALQERLLKVQGGEVAGES